MLKKLGKRTLIFILTVVMSSSLLAGCGLSNAKNSSQDENVEIQVFIAASLNSAMQEIVDAYEKEHPNVTVTLHADSSGTLLTQIEEGYACDIFFSAAEKQMDQLEEDGLVIDGSRNDVLNNQVVFIKGMDTETKATSLETVADAESFALAAASVPVGKYTREALKSLDILDANADASEITTTEVSKALGGLEISEQANVSKVLLAVAEGSCEVGTVYLSDTYGYEDKVDVLEEISNDLTGDVIYPACLVENEEANDAQKEAAEDFYNYMTGEEAKAVYAEHYFDIDL